MKELNTFQLMRLGLKLTAEEKQYIQNYYAGKAGNTENTNNMSSTNPITPSSTGNPSQPQNPSPYSSPGAEYRSNAPSGYVGAPPPERLPPKPTKWKPVYTFLIVFACHLGIFSLIVFQLPDIDIDATKFQHILLKIGIATLLSLLHGGIIYGIIRAGARKNLKMVIYPSIGMFFAYGFSALFSGLFCGWDWGTLVPEIFLVSCILGVIASAFLTVITAFMSPSYF